MTDEELIARLREIQGQAGLFASAAADRIEQLVATNEALVKQVRESALQELASLGQAQEAYEAQKAAEAERDALRAERDGLSSKLEVERFVTDAMHRLAKDAEAQIAALTARVEGLTGALELIESVTVHSDTLEHYHTAVEVMRQEASIALDDIGYGVSRAALSATTEEGK